MNEWVSGGYANKINYYKTLKTGTIENDFDYGIYEQSHRPMDSCSLSFKMDLNSPIVITSEFQLILYIIPSIMGSS